MGLKDTVITRHESTKLEMFEKLMGSAQMSVYLLELMSTVNEGDELICHKFIQVLPTEIIPVTAVIKNASLLELGILTDVIPHYGDPNMIQTLYKLVNSAKKWKKWVTNFITSLFGCYNHPYW